MEPVGSCGDEWTSDKAMNPRWPGVLFVGVTLLVAATVPGPGVAQSTEDRATALVRFLSYQVDRPFRTMFLHGVSICSESQWEADRAAAAQLSHLGVDAAQAFGKVRASLESEGMASPYSVNLGWLLAAYAKSGAPGGERVLRRLATRQDLRTGLVEIDSAIAVATGTTGFVSPSRRPVRRHWCGQPEPKGSGLEDLIVAMAARELLDDQEFLGPAARAALGQRGLREWLKTGGTPGADGVRGIGYTVVIRGTRLPPLYNLENHPRIVIEEDTEAVAHLFTDGGSKCGEARISVLSSRRAPYRQLVDSDSIIDLLSTIRACSSSR